MNTHYLTFLFIDLIPNYFIKMFSFDTQVNTKNFQIIHNFIAIIILTQSYSFNKKLCAIIPSLDLRAPFFLVKEFINYSSS